MNIGIVGASGAVGKELIQILEERKFPFSYEKGDQVFLYSSQRSSGNEVMFFNKKNKLQILSSESLLKNFKKGDFLFLDASDAVSRDWVPIALKSGVTIIDNSATFRLSPDTMLCVPEVNGDEMKRRYQLGERLFSGPNCTTVPLTMVLKALSTLSELKRVVVSTYQSVSGAGLLAIDELRNGTKSYLENQNFIYQQFAHPMAFNCLPQIGSFLEDDSTSEETKVILESRKILSLPNLKMAVTAIRVPTFRCHGESVNVEFESNVNVEEIKEKLKHFSGIELLDSPKEKKYPLNSIGTNKDPVYVGRLRRDLSVESGVQFWLISDNLRKGAALNAVQMAETLLC